MSTFLLIRGKESKRHHTFGSFKRYAFLSLTVYTILLVATSAIISVTSSMIASQAIASYTHIKTSTSTINIVKITTDIIVVTHKLKGKSNDDTNDHYRR